MSCRHKMIMIRSYIEWSVLLRHLLPTTCVLCFQVSLKYIWISISVWAGLPGLVGSIN